ncbi:MAG: hypothetical protein Ct9H300mP16_09320 [Pseudomonadota bacterium]|nr:MAG: hypothetical protein Ct9H300mP16_09320 [Pseudomonadota bacterium]
MTGLAGSLLATVFAVNSVLELPFQSRLHHGDARGCGSRFGGYSWCLCTRFSRIVWYAYIPGSMPYMLIFPGMIIFLVFRPQGIMGKPWG